MLHLFESCPSTNDVARSHATAGAPHGTVVIADHQSAGRGRQGRSWLDHPGASLLLSIVLRPAAAPATDPSALPLLIGLECARALREAGDVHVRIEWPNDLVVGDRKLGGILCEAAHRDGRLDFVVAGVGLNVGPLPAGLDEDTRARATSLTDVAPGRTWRRLEIAGAIARRLARLRADAPLAGPELDELRALDSLADRPVRLGTGREGIARGILSDGALLVDTDEGRLTVRSGSVSPAARRTP